MKTVTLTELSAPGCEHCKTFEKFWSSIEKEWPNVNYKNLNVTTSEGQELASKHMIMASPGIVINGELFSTGGVNTKQLLEKLKELSE